MSDKRVQLEEINEAISKVLAGGQSYKIGSRSLTRADLATLLKAKSDIEAEIASESQAGLLSNTAVGMFDKR